MKPKKRWTIWHDLVHAAFWTAVVGGLAVAAVWWLPRLFLAAMAAK